MCELVLRESALVFRRLNLNFNLITILMKNNFNNDSVPVDNEFEHKNILYYLS
jgi:hypothetical protein